MALNDHLRTLRDPADYRFVEGSEYCELLVSTKRLQRCDHLASGIRGLLDLDTGMRFLIEEERLFAANGVG